MPISCRFYEHKFPECEDVVVVTVKSIAEMGAYVHLLEYNNIEGMILLSELSRRRIRSINKLIRVGRDECVVVIRVDKDKGYNSILEVSIHDIGYIDLSKRRVSSEEVEKCEEKFAKGKCVGFNNIKVPFMFSIRNHCQVNSILRHVAEILDYKSDDQLEELYNNSAWYFDRKYGHPGACYEAFKLAITNPEVIEELSNLNEKTRACLLHNIKRRLTPQAVKIRSDIEVSCYTYEGIDAIKDALRGGVSMSTEDMPIKVNLIAPPLFVVTTQTLERADGIARMNEAIEKIKGIIEERGGTFTMNMAPKVVSDTEDAELAKQLEKLEEANKEVAGDDEDENDD